MNYYAIRQISTGFYLPQTVTQHTKDEPKKDCVPRLFKYKSHAVQALNYWLSGTFSRVSFGDDVVVIKQPHRNIEDMQVISVHVVPMLCNDAIVSAIEAALIDIVTPRIQLEKQ